ncbi:MAG: beta-lactamase family protein [Solobacterium sp.]|nr:beta-lactamase family protein [Solobacterium sp.]
MNNNELDKVFRETVKKADKGAISAVLFNEKEIIYEIHDGMIDRSKKISPSSDSLYMIASNTKVLTTLGILRLWEDGKLDVYEDIRKYIPEFSVKSRIGEYPFTIEDFLMHRSGLVCDMYKYMMGDSHEYTDIIDGLHDTYRTSLPKEMFSYSNLGFTLLGIVIERVSGMKYTDFMQKYLFEPMNMEVYFAMENDLPEEVSERVAHSYDTKGKRQYDPLGCLLPAGACTYTTIADLSKIGQLLLHKGTYQNKRLYKEKTIEWMEELPVYDELDNQLSVIGHSLFHHKLFTDYQTGPFLGHGGNTVYHHSLFDFLPEEKIGCIVFSSFENAPPLIAKIQKALLNEYLKQKGFPKKEILKRKTVRTDITRLVKRYDTVFGPVSFCLSDAGSLMLKADHLYVPVKTLEDGWLKCILPKPLKALPKEFRILHQTYLKQAVYFGHEVLIMENNNVKNVIGCQYTEPAINEKWLKATGTYQPYGDTIHEGYQGMDLVLKNGELILILKIIGENLKYYLHVLNEEEAIVKGFGRNCLHTATLKEEKGKYVLTCDGVTAVKTN